MIKEVKQRKDESMMQEVIDLYQLKSFGFESSYELVTEAFGWREFSNRGEVGGFFGMDDVPWESSEYETNQGISKHGSNRLRALAVQLALSWIRHQPESELTQWYKDKVAHLDSKEASDEETNTPP